MDCGSCVPFIVDPEASGRCTSHIHTQSFSVSWYLFFFRLRSLAATGMVLQAATFTLLHSFMLSVMLLAQTKDLWWCRPSWSERAIERMPSSAQTTQAARCKSAIASVSGEPKLQLLRFTYSPPWPISFQPVASAQVQPLMVFCTASSC